MILKELLAAIGLDFDNQSVAQANDSIGVLTDGVKKLAAAFLANSLVQGLTGFVTDVAHLGNELDLNSRRLGITAQQMQTFGLLAGGAGQDMERVIDAVSTLQERMRDAVQDPQSDPAFQLRKLGVAIPRSVQDMPNAIELWKSAADGLAAMTNQTDAVGAAMTVFGDAGRDLLPVLQQGGAAVDEYAAELARLGGGLSDDVIAASREQQAEMAKLDLAWLSLKSMLAGELIPAFTSFVETATDLAGWFLQLAKNTHIVKAAMFVLGTVATLVGIKMALAFSPILVPLLLITAAVAGLVLLIDDFFGFLEGKDSVIGRVLDSLFGLGTATNVVQTLNNAFVQFFAGMQRGAETSSTLWRDLIALWEGGDSAISDFIDSMLGFGATNQFVQDLKDLWQDILDIFREIGDFFTSPEIQQGFEAVFGFRFSDVGDALDQAGEKISGFVGDVFTGANAGIEQAQTELIAADIRRRGDVAIQENAATIQALGTDRVIQAVANPRTERSKAAIVTNTNITVTGNADQKAIREIRRVVDERLEQRNREAADALGEEVPE